MQAPISRDRYERIKTAQAALLLTSAVIGS